MQRKKLKLAVALFCLSFAFSSAVLAKKKSPPRKGKPAAAAKKCGAKRKCGQMSSCAEARFYLKKCELRRLDRDRDGVPCESICPGG